MYEVCSFLTDTYSFPAVFSSLLPPRDFLAYLVLVFACDKKLAFTVIVPPVMHF